MSSFEEQKKIALEQGQTQDVFFINERFYSDGNDYGTDEHELPCSHLFRDTSSALQWLFEKDVGFTTREILATLEGNNWLTDDTINQYIQRINPRSPDMYCVGTHLFSRLIDNMEYNLRFYDRKKPHPHADPFRYKKYLIPVNLAEHWLLLVVNFIDNRLEMYDSLDEYLGTKIRGSMFQTLRTFLKKRQEISTVPESSAVDVDKMADVVMDCPKQTDFNSCGVFTCMFINYIMSNVDFTPASFGQNDVQRMRKWISSDLIHKKVISYPPLQ